LDIIDDKNKSVIIEAEVNVMLCQFTVKNFKSIRDEVTFDMQAAAISEHEDRIIKDKDGELYLPVSAVYGPNGGGKSNVLEALHSLVLKVLRPLYATSDNEEAAIKMKRLEIEPFVFAKDTVNEPTEFELFFRTALSEYRYELTIRKDVVEYERLDRVKLETGRRSALFERDENGTVLKGAFARLKISDELSDTLPLLSYLGITYRKNEVVQDVLDWFDEKIDFLNYGNPIQEMRMVIAKSEEVKRLMLQMIQEMDLDIIDFRIEEKENHRIEVFTKHIVDEYEAELNLLEESSGTRKLFGLLPLVAKSLLDGTTLVIDELDAKIHPVLLRYIIMLFNNMEVNKKGAQLIFTSHDLSTMNSEVFRRDEIWFVAKGHKQNSKLYSLVEFKNKKGESVRKDAKFDKQYLEGKYGADPYLRKIIDWGKVNA
jgi:AAA15 family ATPase/GTPase